MRNGGSLVMEWNLVSDPNHNPHTPGGCTQCVGALTIGNDITRNVSYYIIGHVSKFIPPGSVRIASSDDKTLPNTAFKTPDGQIAMIVLNDSDHQQTFNIRDRDRAATLDLEAGALCTCLWTPRP